MQHCYTASVDQTQSHSKKEISEIAISVREVQKLYISMPTRQIVIANWEDLDCLIFSYILICKLNFFLAYGTGIPQHTGP